MVTLILGLLSSAGFGSIIGLVGGIVNRLIDLKAKGLDQSHELKKMDKERELIKEEYEGRKQVVTIEGEAKVESAAYDAMAASYSFAAPNSKDGWVDKVSKIIRPFLTVAFFFFTIYVFYKINTLMVEVKVTPSPEELLNIWKAVIEWILFQAGVTIGWWFANRPSKAPTFKGE